MAPHSNPSPSELQHSFPHSHACYLPSQLSNCSIVISDLCRIGVGSYPSVEERLMVYLGKVSLQPYLGLAPALGKPNHRSTSSIGSPHANETTN